MRTQAVRRLLLAIAAATIAALASSAPASAATHTQTFDVPVQMGPYEVAQKSNLAPSPAADGFITGMSVNVVNPATGKPVPIKRLMLHHIVFVQLGRTNRMCTTFTGYDSRTYAGTSPEPIYGAGEERNALALPPGYGYQIEKKQPYWGMVWMLMNHRGVSDSAVIRYTVTWEDPSSNLTPVHPYWMDVRNCQADPVFDVPGGQPKGSTYKQTYDYTMPESGRIVAGGGHVHGGARSLVVSEPDCSNRTVFRSTPAWGMPSHPFYNVRPILHEPGPISMSGTLTQQGYPIAKGQRLRLTANYDGHLPHTRVMGISLVYVAPDATVSGCQPAPTDLKTYQPAQLRGDPFRTQPPAFKVPLTGLDSNGKAHEIQRPPGPTVKGKSGATLSVSDDYFGTPNLAVPKDSTVNWDFATSNLHNVTLANGPRGFSSPNLNGSRSFTFKFKKPGTYRIFCALHPVTMTETVTVGK